MLASYATHEVTGDDSRVPGHRSGDRPTRSGRSPRRGLVIARGGTSAGLRIRRMRLVPTLYAERLEGNIRYRLEVPERDVGLPLQEEFDHALDQATVPARSQRADA